MLKIITAPAATPAALDATAMLTVLGAEASEQTRVQALIEDATRVAETIAARRLWYREYEEQLRWDGSERLYLQARPLAAVSSVKYGDDDALVEGTDSDQFERWTDEGFLFRLAGWTAGEPLWRCRYHGGYYLPSMAPPAAPAGVADIDVDGRHVRRAVEEIVQLSYQLDGQDRTVKRERVGGAAPISYEYIEGVWCPKGAIAVLERLAPFAS